MSESSELALARRRLEVQLREADEKLSRTGQLGETLLKQQRQLQAGMAELQASNPQESIPPELLGKLRELEAEWAQVSRDSNRLLLSKSSAYGKENTMSPGTPTRSTLSASGMMSPSKNAHMARKGKNTESKKPQDLEFATEIGQSLLSEVRKLQGALAEKEEEFRESQRSRSKLERKLETFDKRIKSVLENEEKLKDENWSLEVAKQDLQARINEVDRTSERLHAENKRLNEIVSSYVENNESLLAKSSDMERRLATMQEQHELESSTLRNTRDGLEKAYSELQQANESLQKRLDERPVMKIQEEQHLLSSPSSPSSDGIDTPEDKSPPLSPVKATPSRNGLLEAETMNATLNHAQRMLAHSRANAHKEKMEKLQLRRRVQELENQLTEARALPQKSRQKLGRHQSRKDRYAGELLGEKRASNTTVLSEDEFWEDHDPQSPGQMSSAELTEASQSQYHSTVTQTDDFHTAEDSLDEDSLSQGGETEQEEQQTTPRKALGANLSSLLGIDSTHGAFGGAIESVANKMNRQEGATGRRFSNQIQMFGGWQFEPHEHSRAPQASLQRSRVHSCFEVDPVQKRNSDARSLYSELNTKSDSSEFKTIVASEKSLPSKSLGPTSVSLFFEVRPKQPESKCSYSSIGEWSSSDRFPADGTDREQDTIDQSISETCSNSTTDSDCVDVPSSQREAPKRSTDFSTLPADSSPRRVSVLTEGEQTLKAGSVGSSRSDLLKKHESGSPASLKATPDSQDTNAAESRLSNKSKDLPGLFASSMVALKAALSNSNTKPRAEAAVGESDSLRQQSITSAKQEHKRDGSTGKGNSIFSSDAPVLPAEVSSFEQNKAQETRTKEESQQNRHASVSSSLLRSHNEQLARSFQFETIPSSAEKGKQKEIAPELPFTQQQQSMAVEFARPSDASNFEYPTNSLKSSHEQYLEAFPSPPRVHDGVAIHHRGSQRRNDKPLKSYRSEATLKDPAKIMPPNLPVPATEPRQHQPSTSIAKELNSSGADVSRRQSHRIRDMKQASRRTLLSQSSVSSFASELDTKFGTQNPQIDFVTSSPVIRAITHAMIGDFMWKYTRNRSKTNMSDNRHRRYFWIQPYAKTINWSSTNPALVEGASKSKSASVEAFTVLKDTNSSPPGLHQESFMIYTPTRVLKFTARTQMQHDLWLEALNHVAVRPYDPGRLDASTQKSAMKSHISTIFRTKPPSDMAEVDPNYRSVGSREPGNAPHAFDPNSFTSASLYTRSPDRNMSESRTLPSMAGLTRNSVSCAHSLNFQMDNHRAVRRAFDNYSQTSPKGSVDGGRLRGQRDAHAYDRGHSCAHRGAPGNLENVRACCNGKTMSLQDGANARET